jgi:superfamily I DNA/RNA helicase
VANLLKALELARQLETAGVRSLRAFARRLRDTVVGGIEEEASPASEESENVVRILTMHKAKGLNSRGGVAGFGRPLLGFGCEAVVSPQRGLNSVPAAAQQASRKPMRSKKREEAEEIRLLYVATTARKAMHSRFGEGGGSICWRVDSCLTTSALVDADWIRYPQKSRSQKPGNQARFVGSIDR